MNGLTLEEVVINRDKYGDNSIKVGKRKSFFRLFIDSLRDPIIKILIIALGIKIVFLFKDFDWYETIGLLLAILIAAFISTLSEYGSSKAFERLVEEASLIKCKVKRNGKLKEVLIDEIVVGDILYLTTGDKIGADGVIVSGEVEVDESSMNGEASGVNKGIDDVVYRGCVIYNGSCYVKVDKVGSSTYYGKMVLELGEDPGISPLKERLGKLASIISKIGYIGALLVFVSYLFNVIVIGNGFVLEKIIDTLGDFSLMSGYIINAFTMAVTIIVVSVPEGLPMMVTLVLSSNMKRMLKNNVMVRKLVGIETAGSMNILFTDKTGTLTKGKLEVVKFMLGNLHEFSDVSEVSDKYKNTFTYSLIYNNESYYDSDNNGIIGGNITDRAIMNYIKMDKIRDGKILDRVYFNSSNKYSLVVVEDGSECYKYVKGAYEVILDKCSKYLDEDGIKQVIINRDEIKDKIKSITSRGIRVICVAYNRDKSRDIDDLVLVGFLFIKDEVRDESREAIELIDKAGIQVVMITGDNKDTAVNIAREVGIIKLEEDIAISNQELNSMSDDEVKEILPRLRVVARAMPGDKSRLVRLSQECNLVVGMTGDGVNDAIALKQADVGFSMGSGTEVSKEASDIIILDDNILSIQKAILYGRTIFKNIRKFIIFQLTVNLCAVSVSIIGPFIGIDSPITVIQMLWVNMVMDTFAGLAFSYEPPIKKYMDEIPKRRDEAIINRYMFNEILVMGMYSAMLCIFFLKSSFINDLFRNNLMTAFFGLFVFISIFNSFNARSERLNIFGDIFKNKVFLVIILFISIVQVIMIYYGGSLFRTSGLTLMEFLVMIGISLTVIPVDMIRKMYLKLRRRKVGV